MLTLIGLYLQVRNLPASRLLGKTLNVSLRPSGSLFWVSITSSGTGGCHPMQGIQKAGKERTAAEANGADDRQEFLERG